MTMGLTLPLLAVGAGSVMASAKFETSMNMVQAASGASATELKSLSDYAKEMGAATVFSAGEAGGAMLELAKSGFTPAQIKAGALKATMDLAAAGELELADAATITSNAMNTFGLAAKDASSIAAALAGGANASSADVSDLALALSQVGPGAKTAGLSIQETVAVLSEFADKGIRGSDAGTSLKTMMTNLVPSTLKAQKVFKDLGIDFTNADGSFKSISEIAQILKDRMGGLSAKQRTLAMSTMFGSDATRAATILMQGGSKAIEKYTEATSNQAAATDMAKARMKGMGGALENMKGSLETAGIAIGDVLAPGVKIAAAGIKGMADGLSAMPKWAQTAAVGFGVFLAALGPVLLVAGKLATALNAIREFRMARQGLSTVSDLLGKTGGAAGSVPLQTAMGLNTAATEANTLALMGKGGLPVGGGGGGKNPVVPLGSRTPAKPIGKFSGLLGNLGKVLGWGIVADTVGDQIKGTDADINVVMGRWDKHVKKLKFDGMKIAASLRASGDKAGAGLAAGLAKGTGPALHSIQKVRNSAGKPIHTGRLDTSGWMGPLNDVLASLATVRHRASAQSGSSAGGRPVSGAASGAYVPHTPGGTLLRVGEGQYDEVVAQVLPGGGTGAKRGGGDIVINVANVHGTDRAAATKLANMAGEIFMQQVRFA